MISNTKWHKKKIFTWLIKRLNRLFTLIAKPWKSRTLRIGWEKERAIERFKKALVHVFFQKEFQYQIGKKKEESVTHQPWISNQGSNLKQHMTHWAHHIRILEDVKIQLSNQTSPRFQRFLKSKEWVNVGVQLQVLLLTY